MKRVAGRKPFTCFYCRKGKVRVLPSRCPLCGKSLRKRVVPGMKLETLVGLAFDNGVRLHVSAVKNGSWAGFARKKIERAILKAVSKGAKPISFFKRMSRIMPDVSEECVRGTLFGLMDGGKVKLTRDSRLVLAKEKVRGARP